jgi:hypothetical protein
MVVDELARALTLLQLQQELIEALQAQIVTRRAERDDARMVRALLLEIRTQQDALAARLVGV